MSTRHVPPERGFKGPLHGQSVVLPTLHTNESTTHHAPRGPQGVVWTSTPLLHRGLQLIVPVSVSNSRSKPTY